MLARLAEHPHRRGPRPDQVAHRLVRRIGNPHGRQLAGPVQLRQHQRVTPIGLHPVAGFIGIERRRHDHAGMAESCELPLQGHSRTGRPHSRTVVADRQSARRSTSLAMIGAVRKNAELAHLATARPSATATAIVALWTSMPTNDATRIRSVPHARGSAPANPAQPSNGTCRGTGRQMLHTADIRSRWSIAPKHGPGIARCLNLDLNSLDHRPAPPFLYRDSRRCGLEKSLREKVFKAPDGSWIARTTSS